MIPASTLPLKSCQISPHGWRGGASHEQPNRSRSGAGGLRSVSTQRRQTLGAERAWYSRRLLADSRQVSSLWEGVPRQRAGFHPSSSRGAVHKAQQVPCPLQALRRSDPLGQDSPRQMDAAGSRRRLAYGPLPANAVMPTAPIHEHISQLEGRENHRCLGSSHSRYRGIHNAYL